MIDPQTVPFLEILQNPSYIPLLLVAIVWSLAWKGVALWRAANYGQRNWFIVCLIVNSFGLLEIIYLFYFSKQKKGA